MFIKIDDLRRHGMMDDENLSNYLRIINFSRNRKCTKCGVTIPVDKYMWLHVIDKKVSLCHKCARYHSSLENDSMDGWF